MPTCDWVLSESCLTLVSGISHLDCGIVDRIGFTLWGSSRVFVPRVLIALACAASRSFLFSKRYFNVVGDHVLKISSSVKLQLSVQLTLKTQMDRASWRWRLLAAPGVSRSWNPAVASPHHPPVPMPALIAWWPGARPMMSALRVSVRGGWIGVGMIAGPVAAGRWAAVPPTAIPGVVCTATTWRPSVTTRVRAGPGMKGWPAVGRSGQWWRWGPVPPPLTAAAWGRGVAATTSWGFLIENHIDPITLASMSHIRVLVLFLGHGFICATIWNDKITALLDFKFFS